MPNREGDGLLDDIPLQTTAEIEDQLDEHEQYFLRPEDRAIAQKLLLDPYDTIVGIRRSMMAIQAFPEAVALPSVPGDQYFRSMYEQDPQIMKDAVHFEQKEEDGAPIFLIHMNTTVVRGRVIQLLTEDEEEAQSIFEQLLAFDRKTSNLSESFQRLHNLESFKGMFKVVEQGDFSRPGKRFSPRRETI